MSRSDRGPRAGIAAALLAVACGWGWACSGGQGARAGAGSGTAGNAPRSCDDIRAKVERLYRAEAEAKEPKRVEEAVADNAAMVLRDCARAPAKVTGCVDKVSSVAELEQRCLAPLDDEGTEGEELRR
jgi:hypothetical protein